MGKRRADPDVAPSVRVSHRGVTTVQINDMTIYFVETHPVAFQRGEARWRLTGKSLPAEFRSRKTNKFKPLDGEKFVKYLYDNMRVATRGLTASYDIVAESVRYSDIILKAAELLETALKTNWKSTERMRAAFAPVEYFLRERLVQLIKMSNVAACDAAMLEISTQQLREAIETGNLQPDGGA